MKNQKTFLLLLIIGWVSLLNTAFVLNSSANVAPNVAIKPVAWTPQYKVLKLSFFERIIVKNAIKTLKKRVKVDLDFNKMAK